MLNARKLLSILTCAICAGQAAVASLFAEVFGGRLMRLSPDRELTVILPKNGSGPAGLGLRPDGRDPGEFLYTTSMAIRPGTRDLYILSSDHDGRRATIYRAGAFANAAPLSGP